MTVVVTNTERRPNGDPWPYGLVQIGLVGAGFDGAGGQVVGVAKDLTDATGLATFDLEPNALNELYVWTGPDKVQYEFGPVPASGGPFSLESLHPTRNLSVPVGQQAATVGGLTAALATERAISNDAYVLVTAYDPGEVA